MDYCYVEDGNDLPAMIDAFSKVKDIDHPIVVHTSTIKGCGYDLAVANKEDWHFSPPFYIESGAYRNHFSGENYDQIVYEYLSEKMEKDKSLATIVAAVPACIGFSSERRKKAGKQFVDVGIAEEQGILLAAGIVRNGGKAVFATHASFYQRAYDQISQEVCINRLPVTMLVRNASVWGMNDVTHLGIFDIPLLSNIPNLVYLGPTNKQEYLAMLDWSLGQRNHPVAIRIPRNGVHYAKGSVDTDYSDLNKYKVCEQGTEIAIIALGDFFQLGEDVSKGIAAQLGITPTLINPRYITGLDEDLLAELPLNHRIVITLEDGILSGGFGEKIASFYGSSKIQVKNYGLKKEFVDRYNPAELLKENGITVEQIVADLQIMLKIR